MSAQREWPTLKRCAKCKELKDETEFYRHSETKDGLNSKCKLCVSVYSREHYKNNKEKILRQRKRYAEQCKIANEKIILTGEKRCSRCGEIKSIKEFHLQNNKPSGLRSHCKRCRAETIQIKRYGITLKEKEEMILGQDGRCAICKDFLPKITPVGGGKANPQTDHDHKSGRIRGILCPRCNTGLGSFKDSCVLLQLAIGYLQRYQ